MTRLVVNKDIPPASSQLVPDALAFDFTAEPPPVRSQIICPQPVQFDIPDEQVFLPPLPPKDDYAPVFRCVYCGTTRRPIVKSEVATGGWVLFVVLLFFCFPLCLLGLLVKNHFRTCSDCGIRLG